MSCRDVSALMRCQSTQCRRPLTSQTTRDQWVEYG